MNTLEQQNASLVAEADQILNEHGLLKILNRHGRPYVTGSYALGLMARRDLDVNVATDDMTEDRFSRLRGEIAATLQMQKVQYLNEFFERHPRLPLGFYIGGTTKILGKSREWYLDIWFMDTRQARTNQKTINKLLSVITPEKKTLIIKIKRKCLTDPGYQHRYFSIDIYDAVTKNGITNTADFFRWVDENLIADRSI